MRNTYYKLIFISLCYLILSGHSFPIGGSCNPPKECKSSELYTAIYTENIDDVKKLVKNSNDANQELTCASRTPLIVATEKDNIEIMKFLINKGAQTNTVTDIHGQAIHAAKSIEAVDLLISNGADINATEGTNKRTLLHESILSNMSPEFISHLLSLNANPNLLNSYRDTALHLLAVGSDYYWADEDDDLNELATALASKMQIFIDYGADKNLRNAGDKLAVDYIKDIPENQILIDLLTP